MTDNTENTEKLTPMQRMLLDCAGDPEMIGERISAVLEFLTLRAVADTPFMIFTDSEDAMVLFAAGDVVNVIRASLVNIPIKRWEDELDEPVDIEEFLTDTDPGDEQDEPATEQE